MSATLRLVPLGATSASQCVTIIDRHLADSSAAPNAAAWVTNLASHNAGRIRELCGGKEPKDTPREELLLVLDQLVAQIEAPNVFDYVRLMEAITARIVDILLQMCRDFIPPEDHALFKQIHPVPVIPFNEPWSAQIDIAFEGGGEGGNCVAFPNPNNFGETQIRAWEGLAARPGRTHRDFFFRCYRSTPHEVVHCFQSKLKQCDKGGWIAEHDASFLSGTLLQVLFTSDADHVLFPEGLFDDIMLNWHEEVEHEKRKFHHMESEYLSWRTSCGFQTPTEVVTGTPGASYYFKNRIALEAMTADLSIAAEELHLCFATVLHGDLRSGSRVLPPSVISLYTSSS
ncbi:hypothetical protein Pelo_5017 [Pelomyxa schiedti]|nr:hypothetical protein Pelo_5017 [Pelomyxa schiedti]